MTPDGTAYILNRLEAVVHQWHAGRVLVVMARHKESGKISAFIVEANSEASRRKALPLHGPEGDQQLRHELHQRAHPQGKPGRQGGQGLKIALFTLNTGRLALPSSATGAARPRWRLCAVGPTSGPNGPADRQTRDHRPQDGGYGATLFAMESVSDSLERLADAAATTSAWRRPRPRSGTPNASGKLLTIRCRSAAGAGYETEQSLADRGEPAIPVERMMRDSRISRIFEGSSEVMHLFIARERWTSTCR